MKDRLSAERRAAPKPAGVPSGDRPARAPGEGRLSSLDAFRGFTIAAMLLVNNPGDWGAVYGPLLHAAWHGWTFTDWIFPFFVFISGMAMTMSLGRRAQAGDDKRKLVLATVKRGAIIVLIGLLLNWVPSFDFDHLRWPAMP